MSLYADGPRLGVYRRDVGSVTFARAVPRLNARLPPWRSNTKLLRRAVAGCGHANEYTAAVRLLLCGRGTGTDGTGRNGPRVLPLGSPSSTLL